MTRSWLCWAASLTSPWILNCRVGPSTHAYKHIMVWPLRPMSAHDSTGLVSATRYATNDLCLLFFQLLIV